MKDDTDKMVDALKKGIDGNAADSPALSIDPKSQKVSVVGDPNNIKPTNGDYHINFIYRGDELSADDKAKAKKVEDSDDEYMVTMKYEGKRLKPLYRTSVAMDVARLLTPMGILLADGSYTTDEMDRLSARAFFDHIDIVADLAVKVLNIPRDQVDYMSPESLVEFFVQLLQNEPNLIKEAAGFLEPSLLEKVSKAMAKETKTNTNTRRS